MLANVLLGLGLSAACGFRVFVPLLIINLASRAGHLALAENFSWLSDTPILVTLSVATALEIAAYYVPWIDNLLDAVAGPAAVVAGIVASASVITQVDPYLKWTLAVIAGGGVAALIQGVTVGGRQLSSLATAGFGNSIFATLELGGSLLFSLMALLAPVAGAFLILMLAIFLLRRRRRAGVVA